MRTRRDAAWALAALLLAVPHAAAEGLPPGFVTLAKDSYLPGASALHGDTLVWASPVLEGPDAGRIDLKQAAPGSDPAVLTSIVGGGVTVSALAFDGDWVTWIDDRFGQPDVFALETATGSLRRLTRTPEAESGLVASAGRAAWASDGAVVLADVATGTAWSPTPAGFRDAEPCLTPELLAWSRTASDGTSSLEALRLAANTTERVAVQDSYGQRHPRCGEGLQLAWESVQFYDPGTGKVMWIRQVRWQELGGATRDVRLLDRDRGLLLAGTGTWAVWRDWDPRPAVHIHDVAGNRTQRLGDVEVAGISAHGVAIAQAGPAGDWSLRLLAWDDFGQSAAKGAPTAGAPLLLAALAACAVAVRLRKPC